MLSGDFKKICWSYDDKLLFSKIFDRQLEIKKIQSIIYGPHTITFKQWRLRELADYMEVIINTTKKG